MTARRLVNQETTLILVIIIASIAFWLVAPKYLGSANIVAVLTSASTTAVIGFAQLTCLSVGEMSLAVGGIGAAVTVVGGMLLDQDHLSLVLVVVICLVGGLLAGLINGLVTARTHLSGFIVTLATGGAYSGLAIGITKSSPYPTVPSALATFGQGQWGFIPYLAVAPAVCAVLLFIVYRWRRTGRELLAVGGNRNAAALAGISVPKATIWAHTLSGVLAAVAAIMFMGVLRQSVPTIGADWLVNSFAVPIIGGTLLAGGEISIGGAVLAAILLSVISDGLVLVNVSQYIVEMFEGILILAAVLADRLRLVVGDLGRSARQLRTIGKATDGGRQPDESAIGARTAAMILEVEGLAKRYDSTIALADASLTLRGGQIHALVGENGAGKSTLIKVLTGSVTPDAGTIRIDGRPVTFSSTRESAGSGISVVHQERNLVPRFSVAENLLLGRSPYRNGFLDHASMTATARRWLDRVGLDVDPKATADKLSVAQAQLVEIARALSQDCEILLLDEPTSAISGHETETLFALLRDLRQEGTGIMFVSHKLDEVEELCEVATVLRDGRAVLADKPLAGISRPELIAAMVGRQYDTETLPERSGRGTSQAARLELRTVSTADGHRDVSLSIRGGEIAGLYGLVGAGRTELARAVLGLTKIVSGTVLVDGQAVHVKNPHDALRRFRMGYVSEDRKGEGLFLSHSIERNVGVTIWDRLARRRGWLSDRVVRPYVDEPVRSLGTKISSPLGQAVSDLSGGNQQKASVAKWLAADVDILIVDEPTIGVDVRTKEDMHRLLWDLAAHGKAVLLISSDLQEIVRLSDRVLVMSEMSIRAEVENSHDYDEMSHVIMSKIVSVAGALD